MARQFRGHYRFLPRRARCCSPLAPSRSVHVMSAVMERARQLVPFMAELKGAGMRRA